MVLGVKTGALVGVGVSVTRDGLFVLGEIPGVAVTKVVRYELAGVSVGSREDKKYFPARKPPAPITMKKNSAIHPMPNRSRYFLDVFFSLVFFCEFCFRKILNFGFFLNFFFSAEIIFGMTNLRLSKSQCLFLEIL